MTRATYQDFYATLSPVEWKTGLEIIAELESKGLKAQHFKGRMYVRLARWEEEELIKSRLQEDPERIKIRGCPAKEYLRLQKPNEPANLEGLVFA